MVIVLVMPAWSVRCTRASGGANSASLCRQPPQGVHSSSRSAVTQISVILPPPPIT
jgi:hypothetical protein